jgi:2-(1,2-epoxy-1,2-dihydrophenyl)acetyl-CoA isomerase
VSYETLIVEQQGAVRVVRLNRPERYNALNDAMGRDLLDAAIEAMHDPAVRAVMVTGSGKAFCSGGDVKAFVEAGDAIPKVADRLTVDLHAAVSKMMRMPKPVVAAVNGPAAGAGFSLAMACDLVVASADAPFTMAYTGIGASPDGSSTFSVPRLVGMRRALELAMTNRVLGAQEALEWGLVNKVFPAASFMDDAMAFVQKLAEGPTLAYGRVKALMYHSLSEALESQMELESRAIADSGRTADFREGTRAFVEKRKAVFKGA